MAPTHSSLLSESSSLSLKTVRRIATVIALLGLVAAVVVGVLQARAITDKSFARMDLFAKAIGGQTARILASTSMLTRALVDSLDQSSDMLNIGPQLSAELRLHRYLRSISVLDASGRVLASSTPDNVNRVIPLVLLSLDDADGRTERLGALRAGKDLHDMRPLDVSAPPTQVMPLTYRFSGPDGLPAYLVVLIDSDFFSSLQELLVEDEGVHSILLSHSGILLAASNNVHALPGQSMRQMQAFTEYLPKREFGHYVGAGVNGERVVAAFRSSHTWPLVAMAELPYIEVQKEISDQVLVIGAVLTLFWCFLGALFFNIQRSLRRDQAIRETLLSLHQQVSESEVRKAAILAAAMDCQITINAVGQIVEFNPAAQKTFGVSLAAALGKDFFSLIADTVQVDAVLDLFFQNKQGGGSTGMRFEFLARRSNGDEFEAEMTTTSCTVDGVLLFPISLRDVSHERQRQRQLEDAHKAADLSEVRRLAVMDISLDAVVMVDQEGLLIDFNPAAEKMFDYVKADVVGQPLDELIIPLQYREAHRKGMARYHQTGHGPMMNRRVEISAIRKGGTAFPVELTIVPVTTSDAIFFTATVRDISERRNAETKRALSLEKQRKIASALKRLKVALDHYAIVSIYDSTGLLIYANKKFQAVSGYSPHELRDLPYDTFKSGPEEKSNYDHLWQTIKEGSVWRGELVNKTRDGRPYWVSGVFVPMPVQDGHAKEFIAIQTDVTELRQIERVLALSRRRELEIGSRIQQSLLVTAPPQNVNGLWGSAFAQASQGIDGDFVEMIKISDHCIDIIVGDVMGKGVPAALLGAATKLQINRSIAEIFARETRRTLLPEPAEIVTAVQGAMTPHLQALDSFVTLCYLRVDTVANTAVWVGCGHEEPLVVSATGSAITLSNQHPPMGVLENEVIQQGMVRFAPGDCLFLCSDGVSDAVLPSGERFGRDAIQDLIQGLVRKHPTPGASLHSFRRELILRKLRYTDDLTMALFFRTELGFLSRRNEVAPNFQSIGAVRRFAESAAVGLDAGRQGLLAVAFVEVFTNTVRHARGLLDGASVELISRRTKDALELDQIYLGDYFAPPEEIVEPDLEDFPEGGFGFSIIQRSCDKVDYVHHEGVNTVRLVVSLRV